MHMHLYTAHMKLHTAHVRHARLHMHMHMHIHMHMHMHMHIHMHIPDIQADRHGWFAHFDEDGAGDLAKEELVRALIKTYRLSADSAQARRSVRFSWEAADRAANSAPAPRSPEQ